MLLVLQLYKHALSISVSMKSCSTLQSAADEGEEAEAEGDTEEDEVPEYVANAGDLVRSMPEDMVEELSPKSVLELASSFFRPGTLMDENIRSIVIAKLKEAVG